MKITRDLILTVWPAFALALVGYALCPLPQVSGQQAAAVIAGCPAPGTSATVTWPGDGIHPDATDFRIERNDDGGKATGDNPRDVAKVIAFTNGKGSVTFQATPGAYDAYVVQDSPYWQSKVVAFVCSPPGPTPTLPPPSGGVRVTIGDAVVGIDITDIQIALQCQATGSFSFSVVAPGKAILQIPVGPPCGAGN